MIKTGHAEQPAKYYDDVFNRVPQILTVAQIYVAQRIKELFISKRMKPSILDVGCGCGTFCENWSIINREWEYRGFDFSSIAIKKASEKYPDFAFTIDNVYESISYQPIDYNIIVCVEVLEHIDDLRAISMFPKNIPIFITVPKYTDPAHIRYYESLADVVARFSQSMDIKLAESICNDKIVLIRGIK